MKTLLAERWRKLLLFLVVLNASYLSVLGAAGPNITQQPQSQTVLAGTNAIFKVTANGLDPLTYQWWWKGTGFLNWYQLVDGDYFTGSQTAQLTLISAGNAWEGSFLVVVTDRHGNATTSSTATLTVDYAPTISQQPSSISTNIGSNLSLQCYVYGEPSLTIRWYHDGIPLSEGGRFSGTATGTLSISNTQPADAGNYLCIATNIYGSITSQVAQVSFYYPPAIVSHPQDQTVISGQNATFSTTATGTQPLRFQLRYNGADVVGMNGLGATNWTFTLTGVQPSQAGNYSIVVSNDYGFAVSSNALLTVLVPPELSQQPQGQTKTVGSQITLAATAIGTAPLSYQWLFNNVPLTNSVRISGAQTATLNIANAVTNDTGAYQLIVTNIAGSATSSPATITILQPVVIAQQPQPLTVIAGTNVQFQVTVNGDQPIGYSWQFNNSPLAGDGRISGVNTAALTISNVTTADVGSYSVIVTNPASSVVSAEALLTVLTPPQFSIQPIGGNFPVGTNLLLAASASGTQPVSYRWQLNGTPLSDTARISGSTGNSLTVTNLEIGDSGGYSVTASNIAGVATSVVATVTIGYPPMITLQPTNAQTIAIGSTVQLAVQATGAGPLTYRWFAGSTQLSDDGHYSGTGSSILTISNAQSSDSQNYTAAVDNAFGSVMSSNATLTVLAPPSITTQPAGRSVPMGWPTIFTAAATGATPLSYQWVLNGTNISGATSLSYTNTAVTAYDLGNYQLVVSNVVGIATSSNALLTLGPVAAWGYNYYNQCIVPPGLSNVTKVAGGFDYSLASLSNGNVIGWGTTAGKYTSSSFSNVVDISASASGSVALRTDGSVATSSALNPSTYNVSPSNIVSVAAGNGFALGLRAEGTVVGWGSFLAAALRPPTPPGGLHDVIAISAGYQHILALRRNGTVVAWGIGAATNVPAGLSNVIAIAAGTSHSLALKSDTTVIAWGTGGGTSVPAGLSNVVAISAGTYFDQRSSVGYAIKSDGTVVGWGTSANLFPINPPAVLSNTVAVANPGYHALALINDGSPQIITSPVGGTACSGDDWTLKSVAAGAGPLRYQWLFNGTNINGATNATLPIHLIQLANAGLYQLIVSNTFGLVSSLPAPLSVVDSAPYFLSIPTNRNVYYGSPLLIESAVAGSKPIQLQWRLDGVDIPGATNSDFLVSGANVVAGNYTLFASNAFGSTLSTNVVVKVIGPVVAWGSSTSPTNVPVAASNAIAIAAGYYAVGSDLALKADGTVIGWSYNNNGFVPAGLTNMMEIAAGYYMGNGLALGTDGRVTGWGSAVTTNLLAALSNIVSIEMDQMGGAFLRADGSVARLRYSTWSDPGLSNVVSLVPFNYGFIALRADGTVYIDSEGTGWGMPLTNNNIMAVAAGSYRAGQGLFLLRNGSLKSWTQTNTPPAGSNCLGVAASNYGKLAIRSDGTIAAWSSQSADTSTNIPTGLANVSVLDAGENHAIALLTMRSFPQVRLSDALDTAALVVSSKGSSQWFGQTDVAHDGLHAAQSGFVGNGTASSMRLWVQGPITAKFWWKISSETNHDTLTFRIGSSNMISISGEVGWEQRTVSIPSGNYLLQWIYSKDSNGISAGQDTAWVDQIQLIPQAPTFVTEPASTNVLGGANVTLTSTATGTPPLIYRWKKDGNFIANAAGTSLILPNATRSNSGAYSVTVTNAAGNITSSNAVLIVRVPQLLVGPTMLSNGTLILTQG